MDALIQEFFNVPIMVRVAPMILRGLTETLLLCVILVPIGSLAASERCFWRPARTGSRADLRWCSSISSAPSRRSSC